MFRRESNLHIGFLSGKQLDRVRQWMGKWWYIPGGALEGYASVFRRLSTALRFSQVPLPRPYRFEGLEGPSPSHPAS